MPSKTILYLGATVGGLIGGYLPSLWGAGALSGWSVFLGMIGGIAGLLLAHRLTR